MTFLIFEESWYIARHCTWSSNLNQSIVELLIKLIYLILFYLGLWFIFGSTY